jgi:hypothetical protein
LRWGDASFCARHLLEERDLPEPVTALQSGDLAFAERAAGALVTQRLEELESL